MRLNSAIARFLICLGKRLLQDEKADTDSLVQVAENAEGVLHRIGVGQVRNHDSGNRQGNLLVSCRVMRFCVETTGSAEPIMVLDTVQIPANLVHPDSQHLSEKPDLVCDVAVVSGPSGFAAFQASRASSSIFSCQTSNILP